MADNDIVLQKGESIKFLDYTIKNCLNNDGMVLMKENGEPYESHLGNFGIGSQKNIDLCKKYALIHFMASRPKFFADSLTIKILAGSNRGSLGEFRKLKDVCTQEGIEFPEEITCNEFGIIEFKNQPIKI